MTENRPEAYRRFLDVLGVGPADEAPAHRIAFNIVWHAAIEAAARIADADFTEPSGYRRENYVRAEVAEAIREDA